MIFFVLVLISTSIVYSQNQLPILTLDSLLSCEYTLGSGFGKIRLKDGSYHFQVPESYASYDVWQHLHISCELNGDSLIDAIFVLDTRHNSLPNGCDNNCGGNDISIVYFINTNTVGAANGFWQYGDINPIIYGHYYTWWEIRDNNCSVALSKFNEQYMPILLEPELQGSSPLIQWVKAESPNAESTFYQYDLQRSVNYGPFVSIYQTYNFNEVSYFDSEIYWNPNQTATIIQYRVIAIYDLVIDISNYREINTSKWYLMKQPVYKLNEDFSLSQNYPNPFNPLTTISYQIPEDGYVSLIIYDALGREISRLVEEFKAAGEYTINYNAQGINSGIYFYALIFNNSIETKQMLLIK